MMLHTGWLALSTTKACVCSAMMARFSELHPRMLGALCWLMAKAMVGVDKIDVPSDIRMQSAAAWAMAVEELAGLQKGAVEAAFRASAEEGTEIVTADPVVTALQALVEPGSIRTEPASSLV